MSEKRIIIFGGTTGIGLQIATHQLTQGHHVTLSSSRSVNIKGAKQILSRQSIPLEKADFLQLDLSRCKDNKQFLNLIKEQKKFDGVIISAAVLGDGGDLTKSDPKTLDYLFDVNAFGPIKLIRKFLIHDLVEQNGKILVISGGISDPDPYFVPFSASKHCLNGFMYSLSFQLADKNVWLNSILPGSFHTNINQQRLNMGPNVIGESNYELAKSRTVEDPTEKFKKLNKLVDWLLSNSSHGIYGRLISAQFDKWQENITRMMDPSDNIYRIIRVKD